MRLSFPHPLLVRSGHVESTGVRRHTMVLQSTLSCNGPRACTAQLTYICSKTCSWRDVDFVCRNAVYQQSQPFLLQPAVAFREISSPAALMKLLLHIEIHVALCEFKATHKPTIAGLLLQNCVIQVSLLRGMWNSGAAPAGVHPGAAFVFSNSIQNNLQQL